MALETFYAKPCLDYFGERYHHVPLPPPPSLLKANRYPTPRQLNLDEVIANDSGGEFHSDPDVRKR